MMTRRPRNPSLRAASLLGYAVLLTALGCGDGGGAGVLPSGDTDSGGASPQDVQTQPDLGAADTGLPGGDTGIGADTAGPAADVPSQDVAIDDSGAAQDVAIEDVPAPVDAEADVTDAGLPDAAASDAGPIDAGIADSGVADVPVLEDVPADVPEPPVDVAEDTGVDAGVEPPLCDLGDMGDPDKPRVVLTSHPFAAKVGQKGTDIRSLTLYPGGLPIDDGMVLDVGFVVARIAFVPSGAYALVLGEDGDLASVAVSGAADLTVVSKVELPSAGFGDLVVTADGTTVYAVGSNSVASGGVSTVYVDCDGALTVDGAAFFSIRLADSLALNPEEDLGVLLGGQAVFAPKDPDDLRLMAPTPAGMSEIGSFDVFQDFVGSGRIAMSPDGQTVLVPNNSYFSYEEGQISVLSVSPTSLVETKRITTLHGVSEALFSPDGQTALVSRPENNRVAILTDEGSGFEPTGEVKGIGLADQMALISRGQLDGTVLLPSVDSNGGPNIAVIRIDGVGIVSDLGQVELGSGSVNIPDAIAVMP